MIRLPSRSVIPVTRGGRSVGRRACSQSRQKAWRAAWPAAFDRMGTPRANRSLTECARCGGGPEWPGLEAECERVRGERTESLRTPCLSGRLLLGIFWVLLEGKPVERRGRKATGLKRRAMTAGLPAKRKFFRIRVSWGNDARDCGSQSPGSPALTGSCAQAAASPAVTEGVRTRPERMA